MNEEQNLPKDLYLAIGENELYEIKLHILKVDQGRVLTTGRPNFLNSLVDGPRKLQIGEILEENEESNMSEEDLKKNQG